MKRSREDVQVNSQPTRPLVSSHAESSSKPRLKTKDALAYLQEIRATFQDRRDTYDDFLQVMKDFKAQRFTTSGVITRVKELFKGHRDLILGFNAFLPQGREITLPPEDEPPLRKKPANFGEAISFVSKIKTRFQDDNSVFKSFLNILDMHKKETKSVSEVYQEVEILFHGHPDLLGEFNHFLPDNSAAARVPRSGGNHMCHHDKRAPLPMTMPKYVEKNLGVEQCGQDSEKSLLRSDKEQNRCDEFEKERRHDSNQREREYGDGEFGHDGLQNLPHKRNSTQAEDFAADQFHPNGEGTINNGSLWSSERISQSLKIEDLDGDRVCDREDQYKDQDKREKGKHDRGASISNQDVAGQKMHTYSSKSKYMEKCIQELDLSDCERCTPSYRLLPENYPIPLVSQRTDIGAEVLNDHWVSVTSGSEDYSFKHMRKNQYEESLFRCEDDRFELDMLLESVNVAIKLIEELLDKINDNEIKTEPPICIEDHLTALNLRCIERLYGDHGLDVIDVLRKNAPLALPVILTRLKQKQEEWARCRIDFNKVWAETYARNYHKSLDHRSFYFKQQDTKSLSTKALLAEIKEISDKQRKEDDVLLPTIVGCRQPIFPKMEFEYPDIDIHEDLYQLLKHSCREVCSAEQLDKVMKIWTTFLEPMFGVLSRPRDKKASSELSTPSKDCIVNGNMVKDDDNHRTDYTADKNDTLCNIPEHGQMQVKTIVWDNASRVSKQATSSEQLGTSSAVAVKQIQAKVEARKFSGVCAAPTRTLDINAGFVLEKRPSDDLEIDNHTRIISPSRIMREGRQTQECSDQPAAHSKGEREERNIYPHHDMEEDNFAVHGYALLQRAHYAAERLFGTTYGGEMHGKAGRENISDAIDDCEEAAHRSSDISENASQDAKDGKLGENESEGEKGSADAHGTEEDQALFSLSECYLQSSRPVARHIPHALRDKKEDSCVFYGNDSFYVLFRLHQTLYERIRKAKLYSSSEENRWRVSNGTNQTEPYARFMTALYSLIDGSSDNAKFEDDCRSIIGTRSYVLFTIDKLIYKLIKQLQTIATEEADNRLLQLYGYERSRNPAKSADATYHENARFILPDESLYRIECASSRMRLTLQFLNVGHDKLEIAPVSMDPNFEAYLRNGFLSVSLEENDSVEGVYLKRNKRKNTQGDDEDSEGLVASNGLECKINCNTSKVSYVMHTEDFMFRMRKRQRTMNNGAPSNVHSSIGCSRRGKRSCKLLSFG